MRLVECNKCGKVFEVEGEWVYCPFCENDNVEVKKDEKIRTYKYSLKLEVYEDEPFTIPNERFEVNTLSLFRNKEYINEALKKSFELLLMNFNQRNIDFLGDDEK